MRFQRGSAGASPSRLICQNRLICQQKGGPIAVEFLELLPNSDESRYLFRIGCKM